MPRKLCWIEVDEEGKAKIPGTIAWLIACGRDHAISVGQSDSDADATAANINTIVRGALKELPDATEEVVEAVSDELLLAWVKGSENEALMRKAAARSLLTRLASASPLTNGENDGV